MFSYLCGAVPVIPLPDFVLVMNPGFLFLNVFVKPVEQSGSKCNTLTLCHGEKTKNKVQRFR